MVQPQTKALEAENEQERHQVQEEAAVRQTVIEASVRREIEVVVRPETEKDENTVVRTEVDQEQNEEDEAEFHQGEQEETTPRENEEQLHQIQGEGGVRQTGIQEWVQQETAAVVRQEIIEESVVDGAEHSVVRTEIDETSREDRKARGWGAMTYVLGNREPRTRKRKPKGWKAIPFILSNEILQRLATFGLLQNLQMYLMQNFNLNQLRVAYIMNIWAGVAGFAPLLGAFMADSYTGRFNTIVFGLCSTSVGLLILTLGAWIPQLHPQQCHAHNHECPEPTRTQLNFFYSGLGFVSAGAAAVMPCSIPFGIDQFDSNTEEGVKSISSFFSWYYTSFTVIMAIVYTLMAYILSKHPAVGFTILTGLMLCSIAIFLSGSRLYVLNKPQGSIYTSIVQVFTAYCRKRNVELPATTRDGVYYDPPSTLPKISLTNHLRFLNKAAVVEEEDLNCDGSRKSSWRLSNVRVVEDVKLLIGVTPILLSGLISISALTLPMTFAISQAAVMHIKFGEFSIPPSSLGVVAMLTVSIWVPFYQKILVLKLRKFTTNGNGITTLQRMGVGMVFSILAMVVAGVVEMERRSAARHGYNMSVFWLIPQLILVGFFDAFCNLGQIEFYNNELPEHMGSIAGALYPVAMAGSHYVVIVGIKLVRRYTNWLSHDIKLSRFDYIYYLGAIIGVVNLIYHVLVARRYRYAVARSSMVENNVELTSIDV